MIWNFEIDNEKIMNFYIDKIIYIVVKKFFVVYLVFLSYVCYWKCFIEMKFIYRRV